MADLQKGFATQLANIEKRSGKSLKELTRLVAASGLDSHGAVRDLLKRDLGLGHSDANTLAHYARGTGAFAADRGTDAAPQDALAGIYVNAKAALRPLHERLLAEVSKFGPFEVAPKKGYVSLRRRKQFAMVGPATNTALEVGLCVKGLPASPRLKVMPDKSMCQYKVRLSGEGEIDKQLLGWIRKAYDDAE